MKIWEMNACDTVDGSEILRSPVEWDIKLDAKIYGKFEGFPQKNTADQKNSC